MNPNIKPSDRSTLVGVINPQSATTAKSTAYVDMGKWGSLKATIMAGAFASSATLDAKLQQATTDGGTPKDVTGKAITQLTEADTDDDKQAEINLNNDELDTANGYRWVRLTITPATDAVLIAGLLQGFDARHQPATDATTVDEVVG